MEIDIRTIEEGFKTEEEMEMKFKELEREMKKREEEGTVRRLEMDPAFLKMEEERSELFEEYKNIAEGSLGSIAMDIKELIAYLKQVVASEGFEVDYFPLDCGNIIRPVRLYKYKQDLLRDRLDVLVGQAVAHYNTKNEEGTKIRDPKLVKVTRVHTGYFRNFITFEATDDAGERNVYRARIEEDPVLADSEVIFCRFFKKAAA